ncbi:blr8015 [Bradyrhizobium diazoefficiens USDA 110]|uniref:Blr8015 protein n=1 Tax=Bradyrhizobium diazoefficiens (strain JCM 10833 / BCRC 13528 / IAM 13628 / NBRC 14792 / USDA 110) TaxID=224911 RepID=Q89BY3_BRADU|nr:hypothetical protein Bdiaspc4_42390 [Bradyrhizobium diazoefficiens]BAC53280.1 blr8015 [Bradyrhizobium diazoefficiens USDA 110]
MCGERKQIAGSYPTASDHLTRRQARVEIRLSVMLRGWRRGRVLQELRAAGARSGRERGSVHQATAARPGSAIRSQEQTRNLGRKVDPATAGDASDGAVLRLWRGLIDLQANLTDRPLRLGK